MVKTARIEEPVGKSNPLPDLSKLESNGPGREDELFAIGQLKAINEKLAGVQLERKRLRNAFKIRGHSLDALDWGIEEEKRKDGTETNKWRGRIRIAQFMGLPIGSQVSFLDTMNGLAPTDSDLLQQAHDEGYARGIKGDFPDEQAFPPMTQEGEHHRRGWDEGQKVHQKKFVEISDTMNAADKAKADKAAKKAAKTTMAATSRF